MTNSLGLSIIIPIFNAQNYIEQTLISLLDQSYNSFEIICVDDHGTDNSITIIQEIMSNHLLGDRISLIKQPHNMGAAMARNVGLAQATGDYVAFVDADDWCEPDMFSTLMHNAELYNADWAYCNALKEYTNGQQVEIRQCKLSNGLFTTEERKKMLTTGVALFWTGIYKRSFLNEFNISFPNSRFSEDSFFVWMVVMRAVNIAYVDTVGYHYRILQSSISNTPDSSKASQKNSIFKDLISEFKTCGLYASYKSELDFLYLKKGLFIPLMIIILSKVSNQQAIERNQFLMEIKTYSDNPYFKKNIKLKVLLFVMKHGLISNGWAKSFLSKKIIL